MLARMSKKALALLMVFCMVVSALSIGALAAVDTPNGTYDGVLTFEYHVTAKALKDMVKNEEGYGYRDIHGATLFFGDDSRELVWNGAPDIYWTAVSGLEDKQPGNMTALELYLDNGYTKKTLRFSGEELEALFYENGVSGFYEIQLKDSGSTEPGEPELSLQTVYVYVDGKEGQGTPNNHGYFTVGKIQMELPDPTSVAAGTNYYGQYGSAVSLTGMERFEANSWLNLADVEWYKLLVADGADNYVDSGTYVWHLDGRLLDKVQLYHVNYDANGGTGTVTDEAGYMAGQTFTPKSGDGLTRAGYEFVGWSTDKNASAADSTFAIPAQGGDVTLYAVWKESKPAPQTYVLQYYYKVNNTYVSFASELYESGETAVIISGAPTMPGYTLVGWNTSPDGTGTTYKAGDKLVMTANESLYAVWEEEQPAPQTYVLQYYYKVNNTYVSFASELYESGETAVIISGAPTMPGYTLVGWNTSPDGTGTTYKAGDKLVMTANESLYAVWEEEEPAPQTYVLQYYYKDNNTYVSFASKTYESGETAVVISEEPTLPGYTFAGWNTSPDGTGTAYKAGDEIVMTANMSLYAQWTQTGGTDPQPASYTVNYIYVGDVPQGYTAPASVSYTAGTQVTVSAEPTQIPTDYTFSGWSCDLVTISEGKFTMPDYDVYLVGTWTYTGTDPEPATYTVTFKTEAGGTIDGGTADVTFTCKDGDAFPALPATAADSGYAFDGWYDVNGSKVTQWPATVTASVTYIAKWTADGGSVTPPPTPSYDYYHVTVNYLDKDTGSKIANSYVSASLREGSQYDVSAYDAISISGYTYDSTSGDALSGVLNGNKTVNVYYVADGGETDIGDEDTPTTDLPNVPGGDGGQTDIPDEDTPTSDLPGGGTGNTGNTGDTGSQTDIPDEGTPTGNLPQTGTQTQTSAARVALGAMALSASLAAAGLALLLFRKSRKNA